MAISFQYLSLFHLFLVFQEHLDHPCASHCKRCFIQDFIISLFNILHLFHFLLPIYLTLEKSFETLFPMLNLSKKGFQKVLFILRPLFTASCVPFSQDYWSSFMPFSLIGIQSCVFIKVIHKKFKF